MNLKMNQPVINKIPSLWLREKIFWHFYRKQMKNKKELFCKASLAFAPNITLDLVSTDVSHQQIAALGYVELGVSRLIQGLAKSGGLMIDVGANYGYYSCIWASLWPSNQVIAFEASPKNLAPLQKNIANNQLDQQIQIYPLALSNQVGTLSFNIGPDNQTGWGGLSKENNANTVEVEVTTLDEIMKHYDHQLISLLKIDVEGADTWVLEGAQQLLSNKKIRHIVFEENLSRMSQLGIEKGQAQNLLHEHGYCIQKLGNNEYHATLE